MTNNITIYTNLPQKNPDSLQSVISQLTTGNYATPFQFSANDWDTTVAFFVKKGFDRQPAEEIAYVVLQQSKIDGVPVNQLLDLLSQTSQAELSQVMALILNNNRYKTSKVGVRNAPSSRDTVARNVIS
jgi:hypothetical protein